MSKEKNRRGGCCSWQIVRLCAAIVFFLLILSGIYNQQNRPATTSRPASTPLPAATVTTAPPSEDGILALLTDIASPQDVDQLYIMPDLVVIRYQVAEYAYIPYLLDRTHDEFVALVCALRSSFPDHEFRFAALVPMFDQYGNESLEEGIEMFLPAASAARFNCDSEDSRMMIDLAAVSQVYDIHPALR